jgi:hypothetical protein
MIAWPRITLRESARHPYQNEGFVMLNENNSPMQDYCLVSRAAHVIERSGLAMAGAMCGTFVAAQLAKASIAPFDSVGFVAAMVLVGMIGFYLGIDIPRQPARVARRRPRVEPVELLSAAGTFLAAMAALISVGDIVLDEAPQHVWELVIGVWWLVGIMLQISAGSIARLQLAQKAYPQSSPPAHAGDPVFQSHQR